MEILKDYVPTDIKFRLPEDSLLPNNLGSFDSIDQAREFVASTFVATQESVFATRKMDNVEISALRDDYTNELENIMPEIEQEASRRELVFKEAKKESDNANEAVRVSNQRVHDLAREVKNGTKEMELGRVKTWRVPIQGRYYFVNYHEGELLVVKVKDIPEHEKTDLMNSMSSNENALPKLIKGVKVG